MALTKEQKERKHYFEMQDGGKIRTCITKRDLNAMHLTEIERWWMDDVAHDLNFPYLCKDGFTSQNWFMTHYTPSQDLDSALRKAVRYFVVKHMKELDVDQTSLRGTCKYIANTFRTFSDWVLPIVRGICYNDPELYTSDTYGLDVIGFRH